MALRQFNDNYFMQRAIEKACAGIKKGQTPFGACIVKDKKIVSLSHNLVWKSTDITAHAEVVAIREACQKLKTIDLSGCVIYSTCEPCPMCFSACHWARISRIYYGATIQDAKKCGFNELTVSNVFLKQKGKSSVVIHQGLLRRQSIELFKTWANQENRRGY